MATDVSFIEYVINQIEDAGYARFRKMFGEYMVYIDERPTFLVCDNTVFVKIMPQLEGILDGAEKGAPYDGAKPHYILDIDDAELSRRVARIVADNTPIPQKKRKKEH